jgi:rod shape-determining protein MreD
MISIAGVTPNLLLCLVVIFSFLYDDKNYGIVLGVIFGLLYDIAFTGHVGVSALLFLIISLSILFASVIINKEVVFSVIIVAVLSTTAYVFMYWGIMALMGSNFSFLFMLRFLPIHILYNVIVVLILYFLMIRKVIRYYQDRYYR